jgi:predicted dehydrogenase
MKVALLEASHWHVPLYLDALERSGVEVVGVSDRENSKGTQIAARFGCPVYESYRELLDRTSVDFAFAFGRHIEMPQIGKALIDRKIPFAIEKPCGTSAASVAELRASADAANLYVAVPFILRVGDLVRALREVEGALPTRIHHASFRFVVGPPSRYEQRGAAWMLDPSQSGGGCTINVATHFVDLFRLVTGQEIKTVSATMNSRDPASAIEDFSVMVMTAADGTIGVIETGYTFPSDKVEQREFSFALSSDASYYRSGRDAVLVTRRVARDDARAATIPVGLDTDPYYGVFVERVLAEAKSGGHPVAGLREAEEVMRALDAAYASARVGGAVQTLN